MINLDDINRLNINHLDKAVERFRISKEMEKLELDAAHIKNVDLDVAAKKLAEKDFPENLKKVEARIRDGVINGDRWVMFYNTHTGNKQASMHTKIMLVHTLSLFQFVCLITDDGIKISW